MSITLDLSPKTIGRLRDYSAASGKPLNECVESAVESFLNVRSLTFDELLAPLRKQVSESGLSDSEIDQLLESTRNSIRQ